MISILDIQYRSEPAEEPEARLETAGEPEEYEYILGRRQIASLLFVFTILLMICVAAAYLAGKSTAPKASVEGPIIALVRPPEPPLMLAPMMAGRQAEPAGEPPLLATPKSGLVYIQMGAVEKGIAMIFADGLRKHGLPSFVAPGPSEKIFRVLIGPLPDSAAYSRAKAVVDMLGLSTFATRFPN